MRRFRQSLTFRLAVYFGFLMAGFGGLMFWYIQGVNHERETSELHNLNLSGHYLAQGIASNVSVVMALEEWDPEAVTREVKTSYSDTPIAYLVVYNQYSKTFWESFPEGLSPDSLSLAAPTGPDDPAGSGTRTIQSASGDHYLDFMVPIEVSHHSLVPVGQKSAQYGWVRLGICLEELERQIEMARIKGLSLIGFVLVGGAFLVWFGARSVLPQIHRLSLAAKRLSAGDLTTVVEVTSEDEIGVLSTTFNDMAASIRRHTQLQEETLDKVAAAVQTLTSTAAQLLAVSSQQVSGASTQAGVVSELASTTEEISATASRIAETTESVKGGAQTAAEACREGGNFMDETMRDIGEISSQVQNSFDRLFELERKAAQIGGVISIIEEISEQTSLLALNAEIEAAGAGLAGKRFQVVASEVRRLSRRAMESTEFIRDLIGNVQSATSAMVILSEQEKNAVERGVESVRKMGGYFGRISEAVDAAAMSAAEITLITRQQASSTSQMAQAFGDVESVSQEVATGARQIEAAITDLKNMAEQLKQLLQENEPSSETNG